MKEGEGSRMGSRRGRRRKRGRGGGAENYDY